MSLLPQSSVSRPETPDSARGEHMTTQQISTRTAASAALAARKVHGRGAAAVVALDSVDVAFMEGEFTAIMGPSGSGKSTLLHVLAGLDDLTSGSTWIGDKCWGDLNDRQRTRLRRDQIGFVFQSFNLLPTLTAAENIRLPLSIAGRKPDRAWFDRIVDIVGLRERLNHRPGELSGGQQQRVAVARALLSRPSVVFADEPTGNLDSRAGAEILAFMRTAVRELGQTIVMVTHDPAAAAYADRVVFLADGRVAGDIADPTAAQVVDHLLEIEG